MTLEIGQVINNTLGFGTVTILDIFHSEHSNETIYKVKGEDSSIFYTDADDLQPEPDSIPEIDG